MTPREQDRLAPFLLAHLWPCVYLKIALNRATETWRLTAEPMRGATRGAETGVSGGWMTRAVFSG